MNTLPQNMDDLVQIALSMQFSDPDSIGKPYQPDGENDSFVIQGSASQSGPFYDVIIGKPNEPKFGSVIVLRVRTTGWARVSYTFFRLADSTKWIFGPATPVKGFNADRFCPDELNEFFNWAFRLYYTECTNDNILPAHFEKGAKDAGDAPKLIDSNLAAGWKAAREEEERKAREEEERETREELERRMKLEEEEERMAEAYRKELARRIEAEAIRKTEEARVIAERAILLKKQKEEAAEEEAKKAEQAKIIGAKTWFKNTLRASNFIKEGLFSTQFDRFSDKDVNQFDAFLKDAQIGQEKLAQWWNEYKAEPTF